MCEGDRRVLVIPPSWAYADPDAKDVTPKPADPAADIVVAEVELVKIAEAGSNAVTACAGDASPIVARNDSSALVWYAEIFSLHRTVSASCCAHRVRTCLL